MINWLLKPLGYETLSELLGKLFLTNQYHLLIFLFSFFTIINTFVESYIWAEPAQYWFLILLILLDFITGLLKAIKYKILVPKKIPRFIITILSYTLLLYIAFYGARVLDLLFWLPTLLYSLFILITLLSLVQNLYSLNFIPAVVKNFFENQIGYRLNKTLNVELDFASNEHKIKIQTIISQLLYLTKSDKIMLFSFKNEFFDNKIVSFYDVAYEKINPDSLQKYSSALGKTENADDIDFILSELYLRDYLKISLDKLDTTSQKNSLKKIGAKNYVYAFKIDKVKTNGTFPVILIVCEKDFSFDFAPVRLKLENIGQSLNSLIDISNKKNKPEPEPEPEEPQPITPPNSPTDLKPPTFIPTNPDPENFTPPTENDLKGIDP